MLEKIKIKTKLRLGVELLIDTLLGDNSTRLGDNFLTRLGFTLTQIETKHQP